MSKNILLYSIMIILIALVGFFQSWNVALLIFNMCIIYMFLHLYFLLYFVEFFLQVSLLFFYGFVIFEV